jgi:hypothetical protein
MSIPFLTKLDLGLKIKQPIIKTFSYHLTIMPKTLCPEQYSIIKFFNSTKQNE